MKTNNDVIQEFLVGNESSNTHLRSHDGKLYSYNTVIAQWLSKDRTILILNETKYSVTSTTHLGKLKNAVNNKMPNSQLIKLNKLDINIDDLIKYV